MSWQINKNPEGKEPELEGIQKKAKRGEKLGHQLSDKALDEADTILSKLSKQAKSKRLSDDATYLGLAADLLNTLIIADHLKKDSGLNEEGVKSIKALVVGQFLKGVVENADKIKRM